MSAERPERGQGSDVRVGITSPEMLRSLPLAERQRLAGGFEGLAGNIQRIIEEPDDERRALQIEEVVKALGQELSERLSTLAPDPVEAD